MLPTPNMVAVQPKPGYVIKFKKVTIFDGPPDHQKCFINVCHAPEMVGPDSLISEEELYEMSHRPEGYVIPVQVTPCIGCVRDKTNENCVKFDACVSSAFYTERLENAEEEYPMHRDWLTRLICEQIKMKLQIEINHREKIYLKKKLIGFIDVMNVPKKGLIRVEDTLKKETKEPQSLVQKVETAMVPECTNETAAAPSTATDEEKNTADESPSSALNNMFMPILDTPCRIRMRDKGKSIEARFIIGGNPRLAVNVARDRIQVLASEDGAGENGKLCRSLYEVNVCVFLKEDTVKARFIEDKGLLDVTADVYWPEMAESL